MTYHLVFDATDPKSPRFIELEDSTGHSISAGEWKQRKDGYVELVLPAPAVWQDIATAPRDGTRFIGWDKDNGAVETYWYVHPAVQAWITDEIDCNDYEFEPTLWVPKPLSYEGEQS